METVRDVDVDDPGFAAKVAIVTGGGSVGQGIGNGRAAAILLSRAGASVMVADSSIVAAEKTVEMIRQEGGIAEAIAADVTDPSQCQYLVEKTIERFKRLDFLDNNVGITHRAADVTTLEVEEWRTVMRTNVESIFLVSKYAVPAMKRSGGGAIVNVSSIAAIAPSGRVAYTASKGGVIAMTRAMALDHGRDGVRVNCVVPGGMFTPMVELAAVFGTPTAQERERKRKLSLVGVEGTGWDTGHAVRFLLSNHARYITGQILIVDGGTNVPDRRLKQ